MHSGRVIGGVLGGRVLGGVLGGRVLGGRVHGSIQHSGWVHSGTI